MFEDSFMIKCLRGEVLYTEIDDYIELWHESDTEETIYEFLGMTLCEYSCWVRDDNHLKYIIAAHKNNTTYDEMTKENYAIAARGANKEELEKVRLWLIKTGRIK